MTTYVTITDAQVDPEAPITSELMSALRDNPIAIAEGDASAPKIAYAAISDALTGVSARGVGSYTVAWYAVGGSLSNNNYVSIAIGTEVAGSSLRSSTSANASGSTNYRFPFFTFASGSSSFPTTNTETLSGTWRLMTSGNYRAREDDGTTIYLWYPHLWMRIS